MLFSTGARRTGRTTKTIEHACDYLLSPGPRSVVFYVANNDEAVRLSGLLTEALAAHKEGKRGALKHRFEVRRSQGGSAHVTFTTHSEERSGGLNELHIADHLFVEREQAKIERKLEWLRAVLKGRSSYGS
jgi:hypothetical protein